MDLAALVASFSSGTFTVTRTARGDTTRGRITAGTTSSVTITAAWHPGSGFRSSAGNMMSRLPEGRTTEDLRMIYTTTRLYDGGAGEDYEADKVTIGGVIFEVENVAPWQDGTSSRTGYACTLRAV